MLFSHADRSRSKIGSCNCNVGKRRPHSVQKPRIWCAPTVAVPVLSLLLLAPSYVFSQEIIRVQNEWAKENGLKASTIRLERDLEIGSDDPVLSPRVSDIAVDALGRIYVADATQSFVLAYDDLGSFLIQVGREGEGPGEFRSPEALAISARNELLVADRQSVSIFDSTRTFVTRFNHRLGDATIRGIAVIGDFVFLSSFSIWDQKVIHKFSRDGSKLVSFGDSYAAGMTEDFRTEQTFAGGPIDVDPEGRICYSQLTPYEIRKFSDSGRPLMVIDRENTFMIKPEVVKVGNARHYTMPTGSYGFCVLRDGRMVNCVLVTKAQQEEGMPGSFVDVFDADGHLKGSVPISPASLLLGRDSADCLYFLQYSEPIAIVRYRMKG